MAELASLYRFQGLSLWHGPVRVRRPEEAPPSIRRIVLGVAQRHGLSLADLIGRSGCRKIVWPRQEAMLLCAVQRRWDGQRAYSYPKIARFLNRDHTTIMHGVRAALSRSEGTA